MISQTEKLLQLFADDARLLRQTAREMECPDGSVVFEFAPDVLGSPKSSARGPEGYSEACRKNC